MKQIKFLDLVLVIAAVAGLGLCIIADLSGTSALAQDIPGGATAVSNTANNAGVVTLTSRQINIGTNLAVSTLWQVTTNAPASSTNALPNSALRYLCASGTNVFIGDANLAGTGTNWIKLTGVTF